MPLRRALLGAGRGRHGLLGRAGLRRGYLGGVQFVPTNIAGLAAWYDYSDLRTLFQNTGLTTSVTADGQSILGDTDKSGSGNHLTQAAGPLYKAAIQNGLSVARFNGTSNFLANTGYAFPGGNITMFAAVKIVASTSFGMVCSIASAEELRQNAATGKPETNYKNTTQATYGTSQVGAWHLQTGYYDGTNTGFLLDNAGLVTTAGAADSAQTGIAVGARPGGSNFAQIDLGELLIYHNFVSLANQALVCAYLKAKWGTP